MYGVFDSDSSTAVAVIDGIRYIRKTRCLPAIPNWEYFNGKGLGAIKRTFMFKNLELAMSFAAQCSKLAEFEGIMPMLLVEWGKVTVGWHIHTRNISVKDLSMVHKIESLYNFSGESRSLGKV